MYVRADHGLEQLATPYLSVSGLAEPIEHALGQVAPEPCLRDLRCVPHQHVARACSDGRTFTSAATPTTMTRAAMNPGFFRARDGFHEYDIKLQAKLQNLILDTPKYAALLDAESVKTRSAHARDRVRVAVVDISGDKLCTPGYAGWGSTLPIISGSTIKVSMLYAAHQLLFDLNEMARVGTFRTVAELRNHADQVWTTLHCPPDIDWLIKFDTSGSIVRAMFSPNLAQHLNRMVDASFSDESVSRANQLIMRLGFEYIGSLLWQSGLRRSEGRGLWVKNTYQQARILAPVNPHCAYKERYTVPGVGERERIQWYQDPTGDPGFRLTALSVVTFFTLLAQRRLVNEAASLAMEALLQKGCTFPLRPFPVPGVKLRASKCGLTSEVSHVAMLLESTNRQRRYALAVLVLRENEPIHTTAGFSNSFVKDVDQLVENHNT